MLNIYIILIW